MKRRDDNRQLKPEELEALENEEPEEAGVFKRASADVIAQRRIIKVRKSENASNPEEAPRASMSSNPFGSVNLAPSKESTAPINPFGGFTGLTKSVIPDQTKVTKEAVKESSAKLPEDEFRKKMTQLNKSLASWVDRQMTENPSSIWKDGLQDYIKYATEIIEKYDAGKDEKQTSTSTSFETSALLSNGSSSSSLVPPSSTTSSITSATVSSSSLYTPSFSTNSVTSSSTTTTSTTTTTSSATPGFSFFNPPPTVSSTSATSVPAPPSFSGFSLPTNAFKPPAAANATAPAPSSTFNFSATALAAPPAFNGFGGFGTASIPSTTSAMPTATQPSFSFSGSSFVAAPTSAPAPAPAFTGFSFGQLSKAPETSAFPSFLATSSEAAGGGGDAGGGDEEGEDHPILPPEVVLRNEADTDEILLDIPCKLFRYDKDRNEWADGGKGTFRITTDPESHKSRILVRNAMGKITINSSFYQGMKFDKTGKNGIKFNAIGEDSKLKTVMAKVKPEDLDSALSKLNDCVTSLRK